MPDSTETPAKIKESYGSKILRAVAIILAWLLPVYFLLLSGFILFVPLVALLVWMARQIIKGELKAHWKRGAAYFVAAVVITGAMGWGFFHFTRRPDRFLIPDGYVGWVLIEYQIKGAPPLPLEEGRDLYRISNQGRLQTSSAPEEGMASDEYFYVTSKGRKVIKDTGWGGGGLIWAGSTSDGKIGVGNSQGTRTVQTPPTQTFFVGTAQQFQKAGPEPQSRQMQKIIDAT